MERIVTSWRKRALSLNGRMLAAKTFVMSQIVFQAQAVAIAAKEVKKIERLIYSFVNGAKSLYGPERIARKKLKATKEWGGINGVDVASFINSLQIRQYNKAMNKHRILGLLQSSYRGCEDDISHSVTNLLRSHYREFLRHGIPDMQQIEQISSIPVKVMLAQNTRGHTIASNFSITSLYELQRAIGNNIIPRTQANKIVNQLPVVIRTLLCTHALVDSQLCIIFSIDEGNFSSVSYCSSAKL